ncbi:MAG: cation diffusion facilitator family transporter [Acidobacteria bacterium OLB17]|nr:MAG: cation diffusion facilitator family transporter [Acidobacteria bacterium OLB17]MCZ2390571.1 cation diffusion facilitator family transporter [Acidobacteriota bacterium]
MAEHTHTHDHGHSTRSASGIRKLKIALALTFGYMLAEAIGGWLSNSLALMADSVHMLTDVAALMLTLASFWFAARPATAAKTFGFYRAEILAAFVNGVALVILSIWVVYEAVMRWFAPPEIHGNSLTIVAAGGLIVNIIVLKMLHGDYEENLNMRGAWLHVAGDLLGSLAALASGVLIVAFGWTWADAVTSILISLIIIFGAWRLVSESVNVLLEGTPSHIDIAKVEAAILAIEGVTGVHDLHVWTISSGLEALTAHINHDDSVEHAGLLAAVRAKLHDTFSIDHLTIQMETSGKEAEAVYVCESGTNCFEPARRTS